MKKQIALFTLALTPFLGVYAQNVITTDTVLQTSTCAGGNILVNFTATGSYNAGNVFTAQLSDAFGSFSSPVSIGSVPFNLGIIFGQIPASTPFGFFYKVRVVSSNPSVIGSPSPNNVIITTIAQLTQITSQPGDTACEGDTITLGTLLPANSYSWSTSETSAQIKVTASGAYMVTVTDFLGCETSDTVLLVFEDCSGLTGTGPMPFLISPNPVRSVLGVYLPLTSGKPKLSVFSVTGVLVSEHSLVSGNNLIRLDHLPQGAYFCAIPNHQPVRFIVAR